MLIYDARGEWFFGESGDLKGFHRTGQTLNGLPVNYAEPSLYLTGEVKPYAKIRRADGWMGRIGWRDFDPDARSRKTVPMMILQELEVARVNHPRIHTTEDWIGVYVHECFHVFQQDSTDVKRASRIDESEVDDRDVLERMAKAGPYHDAVAAEAEPLMKIQSETPSKEEAKTRLREWLAARTRRVKSFTPVFEKAGGKGDLDRLDMFLTSAEGTAKYMEQRYLTTWEAFADDMLVRDPRALQYVPPERGGKKRITRSQRYTEVGDQYFYPLGDLLSRTLDVVDERWKARAFDRKNLLVDAVAEAVG